MYIKMGEVHTYEKELEQGIVRVSGSPMWKCAIAVRDRARASMKKAPAPGVPSRPGTPPNVQTGNLKKNVQAYNYAVPGGRAVGVGWNKAAWYGIVHEEGGIYHPIRAFIMPAYTKERPRFKHKFRNLPLVNTPEMRRAMEAVKRRQRRA